MTCGPLIMTTRILSLKSADTVPPKRVVSTRSTSKFLSTILSTGLDDDTAPFLADRIVYSNWLCVIGSIVNGFAFLMSLWHGYYFYAYWNLVYMIATVVALSLNGKRKYLLARLSLIIPVYLGVFVESAIHGPVIQMEHFFLPMAAIAFTVFHPSERRWAWFFGTLSGLGYLILINRTEPLIPIPGIAGPHTPLDLRINQGLLILLYVPSLIALSNAYARATEMADKQRAKLYESNRMAALGQMAGGVAHEIINPLAVIDVLTQRLIFLLKSQEFNREPILSTVEKLQSTTNRIVSIVRGLQVLSRNGKKQPLERISVNQIVDDTLSFCQERFKTLGVELHVSKASNDIVANCRVVQVSQALLNLLTNACDAVQSQNEKWVHVSVQEYNNEVILSVRNSGDKIPKHVQEKLFQPFFTTKEIGRGTGLGLSISLAMMKENGGTIRLDQDDPHTNFMISLPKNRSA
jgi:signal transduction histidine kinase